MNAAWVRGFSLAVLPALLGALPAAQGGPGRPGRAAHAAPSAGEVVAAAAAAVAGDSVPAVAARWSAARRRDAGDRVALLGLAELARRMYELPRADSLYADLAAAPGPADGYAVYALLGEAAEAYYRGRLAQADTLGSRAVAGAQRLGDGAAEATALIQSALVALRLRGPRAADSLFRRAAHVLPAGLPDLAADYHCARASELVLEDAGAAAAEAERGVALARSAGAAGMEARCRLPLAADLARRGLSDSAVATLRAAAGALDRVHDDGRLASTLQWLGGIRRGFGDLGDARRDLLRAAAVGDAASNLSAEAWALDNLGGISVELADPASAAGYAERAESLFAAQGDRYGLAVTREQQGAIASLMGDEPRATAAYVDALRRYQDLGWRDGVVSSTVTLAYLAMDQRDWAGAQASLDRAMVAARRGGLRTFAPELAYDRGALALREGRLAEAGLEFRRALREAGAASAPRAAQPLSSGRPELAYTARARLAEIYAQRGETRRAAAELAAAEDDLDRWRAGLNDRQLRTLAFQVAVDQADPALGVATVIADVARSGDVRAAFALAERQRARELRTGMIRAEAAASAAEAGSGAEPGPGDPGAASIGLDSVAAALPDDSTALLEYVADHGDETTTLFVVTRSGAFARFLAPEDSLADPVGRFLALLASGAEARALARRLGAALLEPALRSLPRGISRLVIVPDGALLRLPFAALIGGDGAWVGLRYEVALMPSAAVAVGLWRRPRRTDPARLLVFADPAYRQPARGVPAAAHRDAPAAVFPDSVLAPLPGSAREARMVAGYAPEATVLERARASEAWLTGHPLVGYRVIHFATHAEVDNASVARTALLLAPGGGRDGFVGPGQLARLRLAADVVVLSACRTAGGAIVRGEGLQGLAAPLLVAGARSVVVTWWPIGDAHTLHWMRAFYGALAAGRTAGEAMLAAKLALLKSGAPPRDWAAFTLVGDESVRVPLRSSGGPDVATWVVVLATAGLAAGAGYLATRWKRRTAERGRVPSLRSA